MSGVEMHTMETGNKPSVTPLLAPNTIVAPDEENNILRTSSQIYANDIEGGSDSDIGKKATSAHLQLTELQGEGQINMNLYSTRQCLCWLLAERQTHIA